MIVPLTWNNDWWPSSSSKVHSFKFSVFIFTLPSMPQRKVKNCTMQNFLVPTCGVMIHRFVSPTVLPGHVADVWQCLALQQEDLSCVQVLYHSVRGVWQCHWWCNAHASLLLWKKGTCNFTVIVGEYQTDFIQNTVFHKEGREGTDSMP